jgi:hypothetical protein
VTLATPVSIVDLDHAAEPPAVVTLLHNLQQLMLHPPRRWVLHTEMAQELERGDAFLCCVRKNMAGNHVVGASLVEAKIVPAMTERLSCGEPGDTS